MKLSEQRIHEYAQKILGKKDITLAPFGRNNWVFLTEDLVLTIPKDPRVKSYGIRVAAMQFLSKNGIPTTEVVKYSSEKSEYPFEYLIIKRLDAHPIDIALLSSSDRLNVHRNSGKTLASIHKLQAQSFGRLDEQLKGSHASWADFVNSFFTKSLDELCKHDNIKNAYATRIKDRYNLLKPVLQRTKTPCFLHGDYHIGNLLFKNLEVAGVLDLDIVMSGDQYWDIAHYQHTFNIEREQGMAEFRRGYDLEEDPAREQLYALVLWTKKAASQSTKRPEALKETLPELERILRGG
ncbi:MAG: aminoglycoside phosphotransferase family protein [Candidatus Woesearchaeota archaeon]